MNTQRFAVAASFALAAALAAICLAAAAYDIAAWALGVEP